MPLIGLALLLLAGLALAVTAATWHTARTLRRPTRRGLAWALARNLPADPSEVRTPGSPDGLAFETWTFRSRALDLPVWDIAGLRPDGPIVIYTHGWGDSRVTSLVRLPTLAAAASRVIMWDLPGHGDAPGVSTLGASEPQDLAALIERVREDGRPLVLYGFSLGAGVSIAAAAAENTPVAGVIAEAPYRIPIVPARNVLRAASLPWRVPLPLAMLLLGARAGHGAQWATDRYRTPFDRARLAARVRVPLLVIHGDQDAACPLEDGREIAEAAPAGSILVVPGAGHQNLWTNPASAEPVGRAVTGFASQFAGTESPGPQRRVTPSSPADR